MPRESKTLAEAETMALDRVRNATNGELVESVYIVPPPRAGADPSVGIIYNEAGGDMRDILGKAMKEAAKIFQDYDVKVDG